ncbi:CLUMA_CG012916, isoform A [Clunio marinus]|uniref:CLUMA_CG012916, isoform A n=1 Tax=Clunio marinus TaxID=568069 RepID=A0A1J1IJ83_9DIPT|nr:CLUMA_CG012916, isoform A [Clunio marinus]
MLHPILTESTDVAENISRSRSQVEDNEGLTLGKCSWHLLFYKKIVIYKVDNLISLGHKAQKYKASKAKRYLTQCGY